MKNLNPECPECGGKIQLGIAIDKGYHSCFGTPPPITHETMELIPVFKCMSCGYSCDNEIDLVWKNV
jgi:DNA-directed RNA polymerase subunit RPC12/RpoP